MSGGWNTIESDAGVFTSLIADLGVQHVQFEELISLDAESLRQLSPVYGVIFLFKYPTGEKPSDVPRDGHFDHEAANNIFFAAQTIQNACGTQALLSILLNKEGQVTIGSQLTDFKAFTSGFPPELRGEALSNSQLIRDVHNSFARASPFISDEQRLATEDDDVYHFIAYTSINSTLYELDGLQIAPIAHGPCEAGQFAEKIIPVLQRRIEGYPATEIRFNLLALVPDQRQKAQEMGDHDKLYQEQQKRKAWRWENALRRHNFIGFIGELLREVCKAKDQEGDDSYDRWVKQAQEQTKAMYEQKPHRRKT